MAVFFVFFLISPLPGAEKLQTCYQHSQRQHDFELIGLVLKPYLARQDARGKSCKDLLERGMEELMHPVDG